MKLISRAHCVSLSALLVIPKKRQAKPCHSGSTYAQLFFACFHHGCFIMGATTCQRNFFFWSPGSVIEIFGLTQFPNCDNTCNIVSSSTLAPLAVERFPKFTSNVPCVHIKTRLNVTTFPALNLTKWRSTKIFFNISPWQPGTDSWEGWDCCCQSNIHVLKIMVVCQKMINPLNLLIIRSRERKKILQTNLAKGAIYPKSD